MPYTITDMMDKVKNHIKQNKSVYTYTFVAVLILVLVFVIYKKGYRFTENFMLGKAGTLSLQIAMPLTNVFIDENNKIISMIYITDKGDLKVKEGQLIPRNKIRELNSDLKKKSKTQAEYRDAFPATFEHVLLGITQAALSTESFISAASFQETTKVLANAAAEAKVDYLLGLKENVVMGHLIPAGTGLKKYRHILLKTEESVVIDTEEEKSVQITNN